MIENNLLKLGFTKNEIKVYLALFELGKSRAGKVIEIASLHRNIVYLALERLIEKDLVSKVIKKGVAVFEANSPSALVDMVENKKSLAKEAAKELNKLQKEKPREIIVYEGFDGITANRKKVLAKIEKGETFYVLGASEETTSKKFSQFIPDFNRKVEAKGGKIKVVFTQDSKKDIAARRGLVQDNTRFMNVGVKSPMWITIFRDTVNLNIAGEEPISFSLKSKETAKAFINYFDYFWNQKVYVKTGMKALHDAMYSVLEELSFGDEYYVFGTTGNQIERMALTDFYNKFHNIRVRKGITVKMLCYREAYHNIKKRFDLEDPEGRISFVKSFASATSNPMQITLYNNKAFIVMYEKEPTIIHFDKPEVYEGFKTNFDNAWNQKI